MLFFNYAAFDVDLTDRDSVLEYVSGSLADWGISLPADADLQLELTAGTDADSVRVYRPYAYQADVLATAVNTRFIKKGEVGPVLGEFRDPDKAIEAWRTRQAQTDSWLVLKGIKTVAPERPLVSQLVY